LISSASITQEMYAAMANTVNAYGTPISDVMAAKSMIFAGQLRSPEFMESVAAMTQKRAGVHP